MMAASPPTPLAAVAAETAATHARQVSGAVNSNDGAPGAQISEGVSRALPHTQSPTHALTQTVNGDGERGAEGDVSPVSPFTPGTQASEGSALVVSAPSETDQEPVPHLPEPEPGTDAHTHTYMYAHRRRRRGSSGVSHTSDSSLASLRLPDGSFAEADPARDHTYLGDPQTVFPSRYVHRSMDVIELPLKLLPGTTVFPGEVVPVKWSDLDSTPATRAALRRVFAENGGAPLVLLATTTAPSRATGRSRMYGTGVVAEARGAWGLGTGPAAQAQDITLRMAVRSRVRLMSVHHGGPVLYATARVLEDADMPVPKLLPGSTYIDHRVWVAHSSERLATALWTAAKSAGIIAETHERAALRALARAPSIDSPALPPLHSRTPARSNVVFDANGSGAQGTPPAHASPSLPTPTSGKEEPAAVKTEEGTPAVHLNGPAPDVQTCMTIVNEDWMPANPVSTAPFVPRHAWQALAVDASGFSWWLARNMPLSHSQKQAMLEEDSTLRRLQNELRCLQQMSAMVCSSCNMEVTRYENIVAMSGTGVMSVFVNPHGVVFRVLTTRDVNPGSIVVQGIPDTRDSWYAGYAWTIIDCARCRAHIGWRYDWMPNGDDLLAEHDVEWDDTTHEMVVLVDEGEATGTDSDASSVAAPRSVEEHAEDEQADGTIEDPRLAHTPDRRTAAGATGPESGPPRTIMRRLVSLLRHANDVGTGFGIGLQQFADLIGDHAAARERKPLRDFVPQPPPGQPACFYGLRQGAVIARVTRHGPTATAPAEVL